MVKSISTIFLFLLSVGVVCAQTIKTDGPTGKPPKNESHKIDAGTPPRELIKEILRLTTSKSTECLGKEVKFGQPSLGFKELITVINHLYKKETVEKLDEINKRVKAEECAAQLGCLIRSAERPFRYLMAHPETKTHLKDKYFLSEQEALDFDRILRLNLPPEIDVFEHDKKKMIERN